MITLSFFNPIQADEHPHLKSVKDLSSLSFKASRSQGAKLHKFRLKNGLDILIIHDSLATKSSAAVTVRTGSWSDPKDIPGLAHFLEHMLFMGTQENPEENGFSEFIQSRDGFYNAFTSPSQTTYHFTIGNEFLSDAFRHMASFFKSPLFNPNASAREVNAVHQEWKKNLNNDSFLRMYLLKSYANTNHPHSHFSIGANFTLAGVERSDLFAFFDRYYTPDNMHIVLYTSDDPQIIAQSISDLFAPLSSKLEPKPKIFEPMFESSVLGSIFEMEAKTSTPSLLVQWQVPPELALVESAQPHKYINYLLNDESSKGLSAKLREQNLIREFEAGVIRWDQTNLELYCYFDLTPEGEENPLVILDELYRYINSYSKLSIDTKLFNEMNYIARQSYEMESFQDPSSFVLFASRSLTYEPLETFPNQSILTKDLDITSVQALFDVLKPNNATYFLMHKDPSIKLDQIGRWNETPYKIEALENKVLIRLASMNDSNITAPKANPYFVEREAASIKLEKPPSFLPTPDLVLEDKGFIAYHHQDQVWKSDDSYYSLLLAPELFQTSTNPLDRLTLNTLLSIFEETSHEQLLLAQKAGYAIQSAMTKQGFTLAVSGHTKHSFALFQDLWLNFYQVLSNPTEELFLKHRQFIAQAIEQELISSPLNQARDLFRSLTQPNHTSLKEQKNALQYFDFLAFQKASKQLFDSISIKAVSIGDTSSEQAKDEWKKIKDVFASSKFKPAAEINSISLYDKKGPYIMHYQGQFQGNTAYLALQPAEFSFINAACQDIMSLLIREPFFDTLRTKQQTGYIVGNASQIINRSLFDIFVVQSDSHCPRDLLARFELFFEEWLKELGASGHFADSFATAKQGRMQTLTFFTNDILSTGSQLSNLLFEFDGDFEWHKKRVEALKSLKLNDFMLYCMQALSPENRKRVAFLVKGRAPINVSDYKKLPNINALRKKVKVN